MINGTICLDYDVRKLRNAYRLPKMKYGAHFVDCNKNLSDLTSQGKINSLPTLCGDLPAQTFYSPLDQR